jgi:hypothetical protein
MYTKQVIESTLKLIALSTMLGKSWATIEQNLSVMQLNKLQSKTTYGTTYHDILWSAILCKTVLEWKKDLSCSLEAPALWGKCTL